MSDQDDERENSAGEPVFLLVALAWLAIVAATPATHAITGAARTIIAFLTGPA